MAEKKIGGCACAPPQPKPPKGELTLPQWTHKLTEEESCVAIVHGQVMDVVRTNGTYRSHRGFYREWLERTHHVIYYNISAGLQTKSETTAALLFRYAPKDMHSKPYIPKHKAEVVPWLEVVMRVRHDKPLALVIEYAETVFPPATLGQAADEDRALLVALLRWSLDRELYELGNRVLLLTAFAANMSPDVLRSGCNITEVPLPVEDERAHYIKHLDRDVALGVEEMARLTAGLSYRNIRSVIKMQLKDEQALKKKKAELMQRELGELVNVVEPTIGLDDIGGLEPIKSYLKEVVSAIHAGQTKLVPRGITMMGPPGVGKTALAEALARDAGFNFVKLVSTRTKWLGESERNFARVLGVLRSLAPVVVVEDEADQSEHGRDEYSGDTGVSNRLRQMRFEFVGDPRIQGKVLWVRITNRPDKLDAADMRSGRSSERIPFFLPNLEERASIFGVVTRRSGLDTDADLVQVAEYLEKRHPKVTVGADVEELVHRAYRRAVYAGREVVSYKDFTEAVDDFIPPHTRDTLYDMEHLAYRQCSSRRFIPERIERREQRLRDRGEDF